MFRQLLLLFVRPNPTALEDTSCSKLAVQPLLSNPALEAPLRRLEQLCSKERHLLTAATFEAADSRRSFDEASFAAQAAKTFAVAVKGWAQAAGRLEDSFVDESFSNWCNRG